ncbi:MAG: hypothetical protein KDB27_27890, partial [Planctomycetales bacterium]|nr:hypothetical protein [Planctomycetales bacterium]
EHDVLLTIVLVLLALLLFRDLRREGHDEHVAESVKLMKASIQDVKSALDPPEAILIGPRRLRSESQRFCESGHGDMLWFNVCFTMFESQDVFDLMLRPAIENPRVDSIQFVSNPTEKTLWQQNILPKVKECTGRDKVKEPRWVELPQTLSFILADTDSTGTTEALLSFWGEPFMGRTTGQQAPRYVFRIKGHSDLVSRFVELERQHRSRPGLDRDESP